jgi:hypothetical protein
VVEIVGRDRENLKELQDDVTGYMLAEAIWSIRCDSENMVVLRVPCLKNLVSGVEMMFRSLTYYKGNIRL